MMFVRLSPQNFDQVVAPLHLASSLLKTVGTAHQ